MKKVFKIIVPTILVIGIIASIGWYLFVYDRDLTRDVLLAQAMIWLIPIPVMRKTSQLSWLTSTNPTATTQRRSTPCPTPLPTAVPLSCTSPCARPM